MLLAFLPKGIARRFHKVEPFQEPGLHRPSVAEALPGSAKGTKFVEIHLVMHPKRAVEEERRMFEALKVAVKNTPKQRRRRVSRARKIYEDCVVRDDASTQEAFEEMWKATWHLRSLMFSEQKGHVYDLALRLSDTLEKRASTLQKRRRGVARIDIAP